MSFIRRAVRPLCFLLLGVGFVGACGFDDTLREYLHARFWLPFARRFSHYEKPGVRRAQAPYAGMQKVEAGTPLDNVRAAYQAIVKQDDPDPEKLRAVFAAARSALSLTSREREEVELIDAKVDMRIGSRENPDLLVRAQGKLRDFIRKARTPEYSSEARGWLAHIHYLRGEQTAAGKIYIDELNRDGSNLSRETLLNSLRMTYGYDGGPKLLEHLAEYFDTPEHAAFAVELVTNPRWEKYAFHFPERFPDGNPGAAPPYARIARLLEQNGRLFQAKAGAGQLAVLGMRAALRAGDPPAASRIAAKVPPSAAVRNSPGFQWMLASAHFLSREYAAAEQPLLRLFRNPSASDNQRTAAAYGLCGVYWKTGSTVEQIRFALWLYAHVRRANIYFTNTGIEDLSVYWATSGFDLGLLLDAEAPMEALAAFIERYPDAPELRVVRHSMAVRLAREHRYEEAARVYDAAGSMRRAGRMRYLAGLQDGVNRAGLSSEEVLEARYKFAAFVAANPERIYFNDALWSGMQRYALVASGDGRLARDERRRLTEFERKLKDQQEERWQAYLVLREVVRESGNTDLGRRAARLATRCLRGINVDRFGRESEIRDADIKLSSWLRNSLSATRQ